MNSPAVYTADEFERESRYLETIVWEAMGIESGMKVLFCGYGENGAEVMRALGAGADVSVIEHRDTAIHRYSTLDAKLLRGSTSVIPAKENAFDLAVAFHYLHEIDPFFHAQVLSELARVGKRVAVVEPSPPADPLGKRIALLYSQAKRELGQFEYYQPLEYWKKLLHAVKADVSQHVFAFAKVPPHEYLVDTIDLLLKTMEIEDAPKSYIDDLRAIARRSDTQLLPPPRFVLVGAALGQLPVPHFSERPAAPVPPDPAVVTAKLRAVLPKAPVAEDRTVTAEAGYEFPPVDVPQTPQATAPPEPPASVGPAVSNLPPAFAPGPEPPAANTARVRKPGGPLKDAGSAPGFIPGLPLGAPKPPETPAPFGAPFAMPPSDPFGAPPQGIPPSSTWEWEPPDQGDDETPFGPPKT